MIHQDGRTDISKQHAKYYYKVSYPSGRDKDAILLDVLFEEIHYTNVVSLPIQSRFLKKRWRADNGKCSVISDLATAEIVSPLNTKLNKLKKTNIEAFYYWNEIQKMT